jgi:hypothetical protein
LPPQTEVVITYIGVLYSGESKEVADTAGFHPMYQENPDNDHITIVLANCWDRAKLISNFGLRVISKQEIYDEDLLISDFVDIISAVYLIERICIEREREERRIDPAINPKNLNPCNPCCTFSTAKKMLDYIRGPRQHIFEE